jgi:uncharacterized protein
VRVGRHHTIAVIRAGLAAAALLYGLSGAAAPKFPALTGRVVDDAGLISPAARERLSDMLAQHEKQTTNQVVVVTLPSLQGYPIEDFGYQLGRQWGIGQKGKDNGVLLLVAPKERKVRIEVGYGLEGVLTDALSHDIIQTRILPAFRSGDYEQGIVRGTEAILSVLGGTYKPSATRARNKRDIYLHLLPFLLIFGIFAYSFILSPPSRRGYWRRGGYYGGSYGAWGGGGYSGGGGGFSGGGGSFGGGGASGGW